MKQFHKGVSYYTEANLIVYFPEDDICCMRCPLMSSEYKPDREYCRMTGEYLVAPAFIVGERCPLNFKKEKENE